MYMHITEIDYENTGGQVDVYYGKLSDGKYFALSTDDTVAYILDADYAYTMTDEFFEDTEGDSYEWMESHWLDTMMISKCNFINDNCREHIFNKMMSEIERMVR